MVRLFHFTLVSCLCAAGGAAPGSAQHVPGAPSTNWERERSEYSLAVLKAYHVLMQDWRDAWERGDPQAAGEFYSDSAFLFVADAELIRGKAPIQEYLTTTLPDVVEMRTGLSDFVATDRLAYALGPFYFRYREPGNAVRTRSGTFVAVLVREGRRWKIRSQVFKEDVEEQTGG
jgi:ketosteroid isomerase-like protein